MYYDANYEGEYFNYYELQDKDVIDENYHVYLSECFLESSMFEKCIQVLDEEEFEDIEEIKFENNRIITYYDGARHLMATNAKDKAVYIKLINQLIKNQKKIIERLK